MQRCSYQLTFTTPAFLGNAEQQAQWRTPPIKALLRQWWRVAVAQDTAYDEARLREREAKLFGTAADDGGQSNQSRIRIRLSHWDEGKLKDWQSTAKVTHPNVENRHGEPTLVGSDLYLGYGPLVFQNGHTTLKNNAAIQAGASATLRIAFPEAHAAELTQALWLMDQYGTLGGRSRNGWGSLSMVPADAPTAALAGTPPTRDWRQSLKPELQLDWPHALGSDQHGLLAWQTQPFDAWPKLMQELARLKIGLRTQFDFRVDPSAGDRTLNGGGIDHGRPQKRHWLSYPVTRHSVRTWDNTARLPNSLRFKVRKVPGNSQQVVGVIFHMPCLPPPAFAPDVAAITSVWQKVHAFLDAPAQHLTRIPA